MRVRGWLSSLVFLLGSGAQARQELPLWEYGVGVGSVLFEQYPASDQVSSLTLPFPTFQYRGRVLRADDQEGARAYLLKNEQGSVELTGGFYPALSSSENRARSGMPDLPWMAQLGPQFVREFGGGLEIRLAFLQSISTDLRAWRSAGQAARGELRYSWSSQPGRFASIEELRSSGRIAYQVQAGSKDFLATYFEVGSEHANAERPFYMAKPGLLSHEISLFQTLASGRAAFYFGASAIDYSISSNRQSPLHRSDRNLTGVIGLTYVLGESQAPSVEPEETSGWINQQRREPF